jgi:predicted nuclease of predicted toxin-antitoxin system
VPVKLLADECCDAALVEALRGEGHDVLYAAESLQGSPDLVILGRAFEEQRLLVTEDKDFGELVYRLHLPARGVILLRFEVRDHSSKVASLCALLRDQADRLPGSLVVVDAEKVRLRPLR